MKRQGELKFTGFLIILAVIGYLLVIGNTVKSTHLANSTEKTQPIKPHVLDSTKGNPISTIYQKASIEKNKKKEALPNDQ